MRRDNLDRRRSRSRSPPRRFRDDDRDSGRFRRMRDDDDGRWRRGFRDDAGPPLRCDWLCTKCRATNFARRSNCFQARFLAQSAREGFGVSAETWTA